VRLVAQHCEHLGLDDETMAEPMERDQ